MDKILIAAGAFAAGYFVSDYLGKKPRVATNTAANPAAANMGRPYYATILPAYTRNNAQPFNPDQSGYFNYATGGYPYSL